MKRISIIICCLLFTLTGMAKVYKITNSDGFKKAAGAAKAGDEIIIADGSYTNWAQTISTHATAAKPLLIHAETPGKVIFSGDVNQPVFLVTGSYVEISGLQFSGCNVQKVQGSEGVLVELKSTKHCRVTACEFTKNAAKSQFMPIVVVSGNGDHNRVDHNIFLSNIDNQEVQIKITADAVPQFTMVDHNMFRNKDKVSWQIFNGGECVQVGQDPVMLGTQVAHTTVRDNTFIACNGEPEVISNKSSGNNYINNSFEDCHGELVMRGGHDCTIDSNNIRGGTCGIRINGTHHTIINNKIEDVKTGIRLMYGMGKGKTEIGFYIAASDCIIKNNTIKNAQTGIFIGDGKNADWTGKFDVKKYPSRTMRDIAPFNNTIEGNVFTNVKTEVVHNEN